MTLLVGNTDLETGHFVAVAGADGQLVRSGSGFIAVGAFDGLDDAAIRAAAGSAEGLQGLLGGFRQLGEARSFGLGEGLERIDGAFQLPVSAPTRADDGFVGRPVFVIGGTESGLFIFKSRISFEADHPVASGSVEMWIDDPAELAGSLLVGGVGESISVLELGSSGHSIRLAPVGGAGLDVSRFEATFPPPPAALVLGEPLPPSAAVPPVDEPTVSPPTPAIPGSDLTADRPIPGESTPSAPWQPILNVEVGEPGLFYPDPWLLIGDHRFSNDHWLHLTGFATVAGSAAGSPVAAWSLLAPVPEPGVPLLLALLGGGMALRRRRAFRR